MALLILLIALALERFTALGSLLRCERWIAPYLNSLSKLLEDKSVLSSWMGIVLITVPLLLVVGLLQLLFRHILLGIPGYLFDLVVLIYCIGPVKGECKQENNIVKDPTMSSDDEEEDFSVKDYASKPNNHQNTNNTYMNSQSDVLWVGNRNLFAAIIWFVALGAFGAFLYRLFVLLEVQAKNEASPIHKLKPMIKCCSDILDWIPVRVIALCYLLVGNFVSGFPLWWGQILSTPAGNRAYLEGCGRASLSGTLTEEESSKLNERVLVLLLVFLALFSITYWL